MNLIKEKWIRVLRRDGTTDKIAPCGITDYRENDIAPIVDILSVRPDFKGATIQFLIGLIQTASAPKNHRDWKDGWREPPTSGELDKKFSKYLDAFDFSSEGPTFMQDFNLEDGKGEAASKPVSALLIEAPGGKTLKDNLDHFVKRGTVEQLCPICTATALFTLQLNAPAGGVGHRVGLRGGGPLTTLLVPVPDEREKDITLWERLWLNVLSLQDIESLKFNPKKKAPEDIFPWLAPTQTSENKTGKDTYPTDTHPCHMYWGMPRRIRVDLSKIAEGECDLCGDHSETLVTEYKTKNYGINYAGAWIHPLSPHTLDPKNKKPPIPSHGQPGGISYRNWLGLVYGQAREHQECARVVKTYLDKRFRALEDMPLRLWAFGYDMDNMKARCWYDSTMPVYPLESELSLELSEAVQDMVEAAVEIAANLRKAIKQAWFKRVKDAKGDFSFLDTAFWQGTEDQFFSSIEKLTDCIVKGEEQGSIRKNWHSVMMRQALTLFDTTALSGQVGATDLKRVVTARNELLKWLRKTKKIKTLLEHAAG